MRLVTSVVNCGSIVPDHRILCLGLIQTLFEGSMYTFVLEWTPALMATERELPLPEGTAGTSDSTGSNTDEDHRGTIPHGYIFASFMVYILIDVLRSYNFIVYYRQLKYTEYTRDDHRPKTHSVTRLVRVKHGLATL